MTSIRLISCLMVLMVTLNVALASQTACFAYGRYYQHNQIIPSTNRCSGCLCLNGRMDCRPFRNCEPPSWWYSAPPQQQERYYNNQENPEILPGHETHHGYDE
ncbi:uncharacterized protein LOC101845878 [Aplysia californica]|uniref:Uncharacterized protein LOC101845878 n=1 Tax=Aplysia californica TaxID=6500 RepID=A0ABM0K3J8_APLCA|nr:uncharacterized protein LOC101845878 [Aplysia californica]